MLVTSTATHCVPEHAVSILNVAIAPGWLPRQAGVGEMPKSVMLPAFASDVRSNAIPFHITIKFEKEFTIVGS